MVTSPEVLAASLRQAATALLDQLEEPQRDLVMAPLGDPAWTRWSYLPGDRPGLCLEDVNPSVLERVQELVKSSHSDLGTGHVRAAMVVERERRRSVSGVAPSGDRYWLRVHGTPGGDEPWAWRLNGHHLGIHVAVSGSSVTLTPHFIGSEPAQVTSGPMAGTRFLGPEEDLARDLLASLDAGQRDRALSADVAPDDILSGMDPAADPSMLPAGVRRADLDDGQKRGFDALVRRYLGRLPAAYADACWAEALQVAADELAFAWAGSTQRGEGHYYCVTSPVLLIEYDNTQDRANHAHSVLRHLRDDFGGDALRRHHRTEHQGGSGPAELVE